MASRDDRAVFLISPNFRYSEWVSTQSTPAAFTRAVPIRRVISKTPQFVTIVLSINPTLEVSQSTCLSVIRLEIAASASRCFSLSSAITLNPSTFIFCLPENGSLGFPESSPSHPHARGVSLSRCRRRRSRVVIRQIVLHTTHGAEQGATIRRDLVTPPTLPLFNRVDSATWQPYRSCRPFLRSMSTYHTPPSILQTPAYESSPCSRQSAALCPAESEGS